MDVLQINIIHGNKVEVVVEAVIETETTGIETETEETGTEIADLHEGLYLKLLLTIEVNSLACCTLLKINWAHLLE